MMEKGNQLVPVSRLVDVTVMEFQTREFVGKVADLIVVPTRGVSVGIIIKPNKKSEYSLSWNNIFLQGDTVFVHGEYSEPEYFPPTSGIIKASGELFGASIVTEEGKLIGHVRDVIFEPETMNLIYKFSAPGWRSVLRNEYFLAGNFPYAYSLFRNRLFVPSDSVIHTSAEATLRGGRQCERGLILAGQPGKLVPQGNRQQ